MTREEIEDLDVLEPYCCLTDEEEVWYKVGLKYGLKAADAEPDTTKLWHIPDEEPEHGMLILVLLASGNLTSWIATYEIMAVFERFNVAKWAYVKDILPKRKECLEY